jgi:hypothetical protein
VTYWRQRIWPTNGDLKLIGGRANGCFAAVGMLIRSRYVDVPQRGAPHIGWGQYLDDALHSEEQWGRYGTSGAVRALAIQHRQSNPSGSVMEVDPLNRLHPQLLPTGLPEGGVDGELKPHDFDRVMKLAYILEGLLPDEQRVPRERQPELVNRLWDLALPGGVGWSSRPPESRDRTNTDRVLATTLVLYALRRFPHAQKNEIAVAAYQWLATEIQARPGPIQHNLLAVAGLALQQANPQTRDHAEVQAALSTCDARLTSWAARQRRRLAVDRPYFIGFQEEKSTDYVFLSPELLSARYFLERGNPATTRTFVLRVVRQLVDNINPPEPDAEKREATRGYVVQSGIQRTVDQAWALELLEAFEQRRGDDARTLLPRRTAWLTATRFVAAVLGFVVLGIAILTFLTGQPVLGLIIFLAELLAGLFFFRLGQK